MTELFAPLFVDELLLNATARHRQEIGITKATCAVQAAVATVERRIYQSAFGRVDLERPDAPLVTAETPFDVASITKALVGATLAMQAVDEGRVRWDTPLAECCPGWSARRDKASQKATFLHLLNHTSGLPAWEKYYLQFPFDPDRATARATRQKVMDAIVDTPLEGSPGEVHAYSDLGYLLLGRLLEILFDDIPLDDLARTRIFEPLRLNNTCYVSLRRGEKPLEEAVVTELCPHRKRLIRGEVHDENTHIIGGVSVHAGVFSTASDLAAFGAHLLAIDQGCTVERPLVSRETLQFAWSESAGSSVGSHRGGWDTPSGARSSAGAGFRPQSTVGHLGFTGTSLWIERDLGVVSVLLTNRVYPTRENERIRDLRIAFQEAIVPPAS